MPSGFTHVLLARTFPGKAEIKDEGLGILLLEHMPYFQLGAMAPDLPYSQQAKWIFGKEEAHLADKFHYEKTTEIPIKAFEYIKSLNGENREKALAFFLGFAAHIVADGIIHPYVRDKVGDYEKHKNEHRELEMRLDVFFVDRLTNGLNLNDTNIHDVITDPLVDFKTISELFSKLVNEVYGAKIDAEDVIGWVKDMRLVFELAESSNNGYYSKIPGFSGFLYKDKAEVLKKHQSDLILKLHEPKDRDQNFAGKDVRFFDDCLPSFYSAFKKVAMAAHEYTFKDGPILTAANFPAINLDTGRPLTADRGNDLNADASYWGLA